MKKFVCTILVSVPMAVNAYAAPVDAARAKALAQRFIEKPVSISSPVSKGRRSKAANPALHLFNNQNGEGFVIVSADDRVGGVLGYSDQGRLDTANMPAPMKALLDGYVRAVEAVRVDSVSVTPAYAHPPKAYVKPLVSAKWSQEYPYNYYTPRSSTSGKPTYTGCTITAAAQVLFAHKWPKMRPEGVTRGEGAMALDHYDWDNMLDDYTHGYNDAQAQAVGALMRDLGKLAHATYGVNGTLSDEGKVWNALQNYYGYNVRQLEKDLLPGREFVQAIYNELSMGCPVFMTGGDHAFVYDGYDENGLVHVNWGWAGLDNGYFDINTASVTGGGYGSDGCYYEKQLALFIHPNNGTIEPLAPKPVVLSINNDKGLQFQASEGMTINSRIPAQLKGVGARNLAQDANGAYTGQVGIGLFAQDGTCLHVFGQMGVFTWATYYTAYNYEFDWWAADLSEIDGPADGTYYLRPLGRRLLDKDKGEWGNWTHMVNGNSVPMIVSGGKVTLVQDDGKPHLALAGMPEVLEPAYAYSGQTTGILLNVANLSRYQARGELQVELTGTGNLDGETFVVPNSCLSHMVAQRLDTTQWIVKFVTSYTGTGGNHALQAGKYRMKLRFHHNIETSSPAFYDIPVPEDFLFEVLPDNYNGRVTVTSVKLLDEEGNSAPSHYFCLSDSPKVTLGISGYAKYLTQNYYSTRMRYRLVDVATGKTAYTSKGYNVSFPRNYEANLSSSTSHSIDLTELPRGTYEIHVDVERDGTWLDRWNANTLRRRIILYDAAQPTHVDIAALPAESLPGVMSIAAFGAPFDALVPAGAQAWYVEQVQDDKVQLKPLSDGYAIPAGCGIILTSASMTDAFHIEQAPKATPVADLIGNLLRASTAGDHIVTSQDHAYVIDTQEQTTAFSRADVGSTLPRYAAYLQHEADAGTTRLNISCDATAIKLPGQDSPLSRPADIYGTDGRRYPSASRPGLYIIGKTKRQVTGK